MLSDNLPSPRAPSKNVEIDPFWPSKTNTPGLPVYVGMLGIRCTTTNVGYFDESGYFGLHGTSFEPPKFRGINNV